MLLTTAHLIALRTLSDSEIAGHTAYAPEESDDQNHIYRELELQGLAVLVPPRAYQITFTGHEALGIFDGMQKSSGIPPIDQLKQDWRLLGSDIQAALHAAAQNKMHVGPLTEDVLNTHGMTEKKYVTLEKRTFTNLNAFGEAWEDFDQRHHPPLEVNQDLADGMRHMHPSYAARPDLTLSAEHLSLLEAMDLLTWSSPDRTTYALTTLGQAAYEAVLKEGYPVLDEVLNEAIMTVLAQFIDQGRDTLTPEQLFNLQMLGYVDGEEKITAAGQAAMRAYSLLQQEVEEPSRTFAITEPELELLATLHSMSDPSSTRPHPPPDKQALHKIFVDRMVQHYQQFIGRYGRDFKGKLAKKQQAVAMLEQLKDHDKWFNTFWDLDELLVGLAAFDLVRPEQMNQKTVYNITPNGQRIVETVGRGTNDISATGVKVLTSAITRLHSPADLWVEQARDEGLIGTKGGITKEGHLFADLAEHCTRLPALTRDEAEMLKNLPQIINDIAPPDEKKTQQDEGKQRWALEKLEARGFIECLVDGQIVRTPIGQLLAKAISGAMHLGHPVTPSIVRLVAAIRQIGTLYVKERKVRIVPENWAEVERLTGLGPQEFKEARHVARMGQYIGEVTITEAGLDLLMIMDQLNKQLETSSAESVPSSGGTLTV